MQFGEITCPHCGHLLWFLRLSCETAIFDFEAARTVRNRVIDEVAKRLDIEREEVTGDTRQLERLASDPLDLVELLMDLEDGNVWRPWTP